MDRPIVQAGAIPLETDILSGAKFAMVGLGNLIQSVLGTGTLADGLVCSATTVPSLAVTVSPGAIYAQQNVDGTAYSSLPADTTHQVMKQGLLNDAVTLATPAPATAGQSVVYLIQAAYADQDALPVVQPYYNASNPAIAWSGPANSGTAQNTVRRGVCVVSAKTGVPAATGSQATPAPDAGYVGLYAVTVANAQSTVTAGNIALAANAPFVGAKLTARLSAAKNLSDLPSAPAALANLGGPFVKSVKVQTASSSGTYSPSAGMLYCVAELVGGGGGGGGSQGGSGTGAAGGGGGAGGYCVGVFTAADIGASAAYAIGAAGGGGNAGVTGTSGGNSTFKTMTANGGGGGSGGGTSAVAGTGGPGGAGGTASGGFLALPGSAGDFGVCLGSNALGGKGGAGPFGGASAQSASTPGINSNSIGSGASGGSSTTTGFTGGTGSAGWLRITEYCTQ